MEREAIKLTGAQETLPGLVFDRGWWYPDEPELRLLIQGLLHTPLRRMGRACAITSARARRRAARNGRRNDSATVTVDPALSGRIEGK